MIYKVSAHLNECGCRHVKDFYNGGVFTYEIKLTIKTDEIKNKQQRAAVCINILNLYREAYKNDGAIIPSHIYYDFRFTKKEAAENAIAIKSTL